jgi:hypothetical protein
MLQPRLACLPNCAAGVVPDIVLMMYRTQWCAELMLDLLLFRFYQQPPEVRAQTTATAAATLVESHKRN